MKYSLIEVNEKIKKLREKNGKVRLGIKPGKFIYIFTNIKNNKKYIGKTIDIIARIDSYLQEGTTNNIDLVNDIKNDINSFEIEIINKIDGDLKLIESEYIKELGRNYILYNISEYKEKRKKQKIDVVLGGIRFTSKSELKKYNRELLESYKDGTFITNQQHYNFAYDLMKYNQNYNIEYGSRLKVQIDNRNEEDSGFGRSKGYNNFRFEINGEFIQLSSNKCIENINKTLTP